MTETIFVVIGLILVVGPIALIVQKAGYSALWALLAFIPFVNFFAIIYFAVTEWPIERELQRLRPGPKSPADIKAETSWELKRLTKRVALLEQLAAPEGPNETAQEMLNATGNTASEYLKQTVISLEQFLERPADQDETAAAEKLLKAARDCESQMQNG